MKKIINILILLNLIVLLIFYLKICLIRFNSTNYDKELPLIGIQDIVKFDNKIYIGLSHFNRLQVYDLNGQFLKCIPINNHHKDFSFKVGYNEDVSFNVFYRENVKEKFPLDNITYYLEKKYPAHIFSFKKQKKETFIENDLFLLIRNSDVLLLVTIMFCIGFFYVLNSSIIQKHLDGTEAKDLKLYKKILLDIFK